MYRLHSILILLLIVFSCKKYELPPSGPSVIYPETFPDLYSGNGVWLVDRLLIENPSEPNLTSEIIDAGTLHFYADSLLIFSKIDNTVDSFSYIINQNKSVLTLSNESGFIGDCPVRWTNANKMNFLVHTEEGGIAVNKTFFVTR